MFCLELFAVRLGSYFLHGTMTDLINVTIASSWSPYMVILSIPCGLNTPRTSTRLGDLYCEFEIYIA